MNLGPLPATGQWVRLELDAQSVGLAPDSWVTGVSFTQFDGKVNWDKSGIVTRILQWPLPSEDQSAWEEYELGSPQPPTGLSKAILDILQIAPAQRNESQRSEARNHFIWFIYGPGRATLAPVNTELETQQALETRTNNAIVTTMVMTEMSQRRPAHVLIRGNYQAQGDATQRLSYGFQLCVARLPDSRELGILDRIYTGQLAKYQANPDAAEKLIKNGSAPRLENVPAAELAAWTTVANTLLNLDETITRE